MITGPTDKLNAGTIAWITHKQNKPFHVAISTVNGAGVFRVSAHFLKLLWVRAGWLPKDPFNYYNRMAVMVIWKNRTDQIGVLHGAN